MNIIHQIMKGGNIIIDNEEQCLLSPSIKCDDTINYLLYSSKIISNEDEYKNYMNSYNLDSIIDPKHNYLIELPNKECNVLPEQVKKCSNLEINDKPNQYIKNIISEQSYSLNDYINDPNLLQEFINDNPNFANIFLDEFKNLFEGLKYLSEKNIAHQNINPKNIIFNTQTKKMKFIDFGKRENKSTLIEKFYKNKNYKYNLKIYYPFLSFFMNEENYKIYKNLNNTQDKEFIHFLEHFFFNTPYVSSTTSANRNNDLNKLKIQFRDTEELRKYKNYIQSTYDKNFFKDVLVSFRNTYLIFCQNKIKKY